VAIKHAFTNHTPKQKKKQNKKTDRQFQQVMVPVEVPTTTTPLATQT
jgi:hypothetical protein